MTKYILTLFLIGANFTGFSQIEKYRTYNELVTSARTHSAQNQYDSAIIYYDSALSLIDFDPGIYISIAMTVYSTGNYDKISYYLEKGFTKGWDPNYITVDHLTPYYNSKSYQDLLLKQDSLQAIHLASIDTNFRNCIDSIANENYIRQQKDPNSDIKTDETLFESFMHHVKTNGYPTYSKTGNAFNSAYFFLLGQIDSYPNQSFWPELFPYIDKEIEAGKITPLFYIRFEEQRVDL